MLPVAVSNKYPLVTIPSEMCERQIIDSLSVGETYPVSLFSCDPCNVAILMIECGVCMELVGEKHYHIMKPLQQF